jgi:hypothetical protein
MLVQLEVDDDSIDQLMVKTLSDNILYLCPKEESELIDAMKCVCDYFSVEGI